MINYCMSFDFFFHDLIQFGFFSTSYTPNQATETEKNSLLPGKNLEQD